MVDFCRPGHILFEMSLHTSSYYEYLNYFPYYIATPYHNKINFFHHDHRKSYHIHKLVQNASSVPNVVSNI